MFNRKHLWPMNETVPAPSNNDKIVTAKGKPGKYLRAKIIPSGLHSSNICDYGNKITIKNESCLHSALKIPLGGRQREKRAEGLQGWRNPSCWVLWTNRFFLIATHL